MENLDEVKEAMNAKRTPKKEPKPKAVAPVEESAEVQAEIQENLKEQTDAVKESKDQQDFPGCNTCRNFGNYPAWHPCSDCRNNPKNKTSYYQA